MAAKRTHTPAGRDKTLFPHLNNKLPIGSALSIIVPEDKCWKREKRNKVYVERLQLGEIFTIKVLPQNVTD